VPSTCERRKNRERAYDFCVQNFQAWTARFGDAHCGDLLARLIAVEETLAAVRTSAQAIEGSEGSLWSDTEAENLRGSAE
jgi:hypothetical protein